MRCDFPIAQTAAASRSSGRTQSPSAIGPRPSRWPRSVRPAESSPITCSGKSARRPASSTYRSDKSCRFATRTTRRVVRATPRQSAGWPGSGRNPHAFGARRGGRSRVRAVTSRRCATPVASNRGHPRRSVLPVSAVGQLVLSLPVQASKTQEVLGKARVRTGPSRSSHLVSRRDPDNSPRVVRATLRDGQGLFSEDRLFWQLRRRATGLTRNETSFEGLTCREEVLCAEPSGNLACNSNLWTAAVASSR
jgi:hypothetical protein